MLLPIMQPVPLADLPSGIQVRIIGAAGAGFPSPAQDWEDDAISLIELLRLDRAASFVFRISGGSMVDAGIYDNDVVVVDRDTRPADGHIVIAIVDGGFVCRQLCRRQGQTWLEARNAHQRYAPTAAEGIEIWGVVRTGVRDYRR
ncbi:LexA family protein [Altericroceibacterium xinjiangense]|uniref:LexA family protein n=1 Tax=Altericroceibacterium xinjiangense TaxID=762261 RepID=UPI000F7F8AE0|nr:S24 family peptidase [Altericroceibacterium xinjiangense]